MDFDKLDEAVRKLKEALELPEDWEYCIRNRGLSITIRREVVVLDWSHRVLDLLAGIEACCATLYYSWKEKALHMMLYRVSYGENSKARFDGELPAAVLAAVESDEFKAWVETEKARAQK